MTSYAVNNILQHSVIPRHSFTFSRCSALPKENVPREIRSKVFELCSCLGLSEQSEEIKYYKPAHILQQGNPSRSSDERASGTTLLGNAFDDINCSCHSVLAVYTPSHEHGCRIDAFSDLWTRQQLAEIVLYCSCQKATSRGLPCEHEMHYILTSPSRNMRNVVWLCHPTYLRGYKAP